MQRQTPLRAKLQVLTLAGVVAAILNLSGCATRPAPVQRKAPPLPAAAIWKPTGPVIPAGPPVKFNWQACGLVEVPLRDLVATQAKAEQNDACAQYALGLAFDNGIGRPVNDAQAAAWYQRASNLGQAEAQNNLGLLFLGGKGVIRNVDQARDLLLLAEHNGLSAATLNLGLIFADPKVPYHDDVRALQYFRRAADQGLGDAQYNVGLFYRQGRAVPVDPQQALQWFQKAAQQNVANAQFNLATMYYQGVGQGAGRSAPDKTKAAQWYLRAAQGGITQAQFSIGVMARKGEGIPQSPELALLWYSEAAQKDFVEAQTQLAQLYASGQGALKNPFLAYFWQRIYVANRPESAEARTLLDAMAKALNAQQIQQAVYKLSLYRSARAGATQYDKTALAQWQQRNLDFLVNNQRTANVKVTASGLQYRAMRAGSGRAPADGEKVRVNYRLGLIDGDLVDSSATRNAPLKLEIDKVTAGLREGLKLTRVGGRTRLFIPASLAYGARGSGTRVPPASTLVIDIEVLDIERAAGSAASAAAARKG